MFAATCVTLIYLTLWLAEVFDFSKDEMTSAKIKAMKESLNAEFQSVFNLCDFILTRSQRPQLIKVASYLPTRCPP